MESFYHINTKNGNSYLIDNHTSYLSIYPNDKSEYTHELSDSINNTEYYRRKKEYLKKMGVLSSKKKIDFKYSIKEEDIITLLANTMQITFEVTNVCNLDCIYCAYGKLYTNYDVRYNQKMDIKLAYSMLKYMNNLWNSKYNHSEGIIDIGFYGGEPLLNIDFIKKLFLL